MRTERPVRSGDSSRPASVLGFAIPILAFLRMAIREATRDDLRKKTPLEWYNQEISKKPHDVGLWYAKGSLLAKMGEHLDAISCFEKVTELDPGHHKGWDAEAKAYFRMGNYEKSISALDRLTEMDEENETLWYMKGEALLKLGRYVEANECYDKAIELDPNYADAWCGKGNALKGIGEEKPRGIGEEKPRGIGEEKPRGIGEEKPRGKDLDEDEAQQREKLFGDALECFKRVLSLNPHHYEAMGSRGSLLCEMREFEEGLSEIDKATEGDPNLYELMFQKAKVLELQGRREEAAEIFERLFNHLSSKKGGESIDDLYWKGVVATEIGRNQTALINFNRILDLNPQHVSTWVAKGNTQRDLGMVEDALFSYEKATSIAPSMTDAWYRKGLVLYALERFREASRSFLEVLELDPSHPGATKMKDEIQSRLFSKVETEIDLSPKSLEVQESCPYPLAKETMRAGALSKEGLVHTGIRFFSQKEFEEAFECFEQAIEIDDQDHTLWEWKGDTLVELERYSEAIECYDRAIKLKHREGREEKRQAPELEVPKGTTKQNIEQRPANGLSVAHKTTNTNVGTMTQRRRLQKHSDANGQTRFSIDKRDRFILDTLLKDPKTIREISVLCQTEMATLFPRIELLRACGFLKQFRKIVTLERGTRRLCLYQTDIESYRLLTA